MSEWEEYDVKRLEEAIRDLAGAVLEGAAPFEFEYREYRGDARGLRLVVMLKAADGRELLGSSAPMVDGQSLSGWKFSALRALAGRARSSGYDWLRTVVVRLQGLEHAADPPVER